jgi:hypothetical protein
MTEQREIVAAEPPLDCRVIRSDWQSVWTRPEECGWYEYDGWLIDEGTKLYWNGNQWGYWINEQPRRNWTQMAEVATDKWRGILAHNAEVTGA